MTGDFRKECPPFSYGAGLAEPAPPHDIGAIMPASPPFESWIRPEPSGLYCIPGGFHIDPHAPVDRAVITHGQKAMPSFGTLLNDQQVADVVNYIRTNFGNKYKDKVKPEDVKAQR